MRKHNEELFGVDLPVNLVLFSYQASADHCYQSNPAGGRIPVDCVHPERDPLQAPGPVRSELPGVNEAEIEMINELMDQQEKAIEAPVRQAPQR